jgi:hypothetical protein
MTNEEIDLQSLEEKKKKRKKKRKVRKKKKGKKDACYHKVKSRYKVWPSAYASGALVKCRKVGAKKWGNKSKKKNESMERTTMKIRIIKESKESKIERLFKPGLLEHVKTKTPLHENIFRVGSECYFNTIKQGRKFYNMGLYEAINEEERDMLENTELGEWALFEGERVPLDFPLYTEEYEQLLDEKKGSKRQRKKKAKKKKDPPIGKPTKNTGGGKKYKVYVRNPKTGNVKKITYGDSKGGLKGNWNSAEARKSFAARHNCADKKDRTKSGYWACRAHKDFGSNVPGRFW